MKKLTVFVALFLMIGWNFMTSCTNDDDSYFENEASDKKLQELKVKILHIAAEYGFDDIEIDESRLRLNLNLTDKQIEQSVKLLSAMEGTFILEKGEDGRIYSSKIVKRLSATRDGYNRGYESRNGEYEDEQVLNDGLKVNYSFNYEYNQGDNDDFNPNFSLSYREVDKNGNYTGEWIDYEVVSTKEYLNTTFSGSIDNLEINYYYVVTVRDPKTGLMKSYSLDGVYTAGSGRGSVSVHK